MCSPKVLQNVARQSPAKELRDSFVISYLVPTAGAPGTLIVNQQQPLVGSLQAVTVHQTQVVLCTARLVGEKQLEFATNDSDR